MDILTGKKYRRFRFLTWTLSVGQFVHLVGAGGRGWMSVIVILSSLEYLCIGVHENLMQHPSNNILIFVHIQVERKINVKIICSPFFPLIDTSYKSQNSAGKFLFLF